LFSYFESIFMPQALSMGVFGMAGAGFLIFQAESAEHWLPTKGLRVLAASNGRLRRTVEMTGFGPATETSN
jgi:hypothetical protein